MKMPLRYIVLSVIFIVLYFLLTVPYPQGVYKPLIFNCIPAPLFAWMIWTILMMIFDYVVFFIFDPYAWMDE